MDTSRGAFIVIEGSDGSGKATQLLLAKQRLEAAGYAVETFDFPQYDQPSSFFVKRYLQGDYGTVDEVGPYTSSLFYALDRFEAAPRIREALVAGKVVISNRFTGSNMAHQGTKIANAEQRRGFFIWLDNLEFEMLKIPRPNVSFILRVPADISQQLMATKKHDIHEADMTHLARTVSVYDDMTQLFPKDFQRIDCVRSGQLLSIENIHAMLWEKISPLLPPPTPIAPARPTAAVPAEQPKPIEEAVVAKTANSDIVLTGVSSLVVQRIERFATSARIELAEIPTTFVPQNLISAAQKVYQAKMAELLQLSAKLRVGLTKRGSNEAEAKVVAELALPVATSATIRMDVNDPGLENLITTLLNDALPEAQAVGADILAQAAKAMPGRFTQATQPVQQASPQTIQRLAEEFLAQNHIGDQPPVQLMAVWPRNENDLVADMLYSHTSLPLRTIQDRVAAWPMSRKLQVVEAYVGDSRPGPVLEKAHYSWDVLGGYAAFRELQSFPSEALQMQQLTPRYGFDMPKSIEKAGLVDTYEKCFEISLQLYSELQQAGHQLEAQYATLQGHNQRWKLTQNAAQFAHMRRSAPASPTTQKLLADMHTTLSEAHPAIGESLAGQRLDQHPGLNPQGV